MRVLFGRPRLRPPAPYGLAPVTLASAEHSDGGLPAKSRLIGRIQAPKTRGRNSSRHLIDKEEVIGRVGATKTGVNPPSYPFGPKMIGKRQFFGSRWPPAEVTAFPSDDAKLNLSAIQRNSRRRKGDQFLAIDNRIFRALMTTHLPGVSCRQTGRVNEIPLFANDFEESRTPHLERGQ